MKRLPVLLALTALLIGPASVQAQKKGEDKSKRPSPPAVATETIKGGAKITINYSQPSVKGRTIGKDLEPMDGQIWRAGANEATVFETNKALKVEGSPLPAGKYAFFVLKKGAEWTLIFNKTWKTWGAYEYDKNKGDDVISVTVPEKAANPQAEKLRYTISKDGRVSLVWGDKMATFRVATAD